MNPDLQNWLDSLNNISNNVAGTAALVAANLNAPSPAATAQPAIPATIAPPSYFGVSQNTAIAIAIGVGAVFLLLHKAG